MNDSQRGSQEGELADEQLWPMGAVTRRTGIGEHTLRAWERRFGFPDPHRLPSGHRRYTKEQVHRLVLINQALQCGYRAGDVVPLSLDRLQAILDGCAQSKPATAEVSAEWIDRLLDAARRLDRDELVAGLQRDATVLGVPGFLRHRVAPALTAIGEAWSSGTLEIRHEHFFSQVLEDTLRTFRVPLGSKNSGRPIVLACLPNELHTLGLQIAALAVVAAGRNVRIIGAHTPVDEIVEAAASVDAAVVGLSVSVSSVSEETSAEIVSIRDRLPSRTRLWLGGGGASRLEGIPVNVEVIGSLDELDRALDGLAT